MSIKNIPVGASLLTLFGLLVIRMGLIAWVSGSYVLGRRGPSQLHLAGSDAKLASLITIAVGFAIILGCAIEMSRHVKEL